MNSAQFNTIQFNSNPSSAVNINVTCELLSTESNVFELSNIITIQNVSVTLPLLETISEIFDSTFTNHQDVIITLPILTSDSQIFSPTVIAIQNVNVLLNILKTDSEVLDINKVSISSLNKLGILTIDSEIFSVTVLTTSAGINGLLLYRNLEQTDIIPNDGSNFIFDFGTLHEQSYIYPFYIKNQRVDTLTNLYLSINYNQPKILYGADFIYLSLNGVDFSPQPIQFNSLATNEGQPFYVKFSPMLGIENRVVSVNFAITKR